MVPWSPQMPRPHPAEGPKDSKNDLNDREACQIHDHAAEELKYFDVILIFERKIHS